MAQPKTSRAKAVRALSGRALAGRALAVLALAGGALGGFAPARADVIEVGDDGQARVRAGGGDVQWISLDAPGEPAEAEDAPAVPAAAVTELAAPAVPAAWAPLLARVADAYHVSPDLLAALVWQESGWRPAALSGKGAIGLAQLMPGTARDLRLDPRDPASNLAGGAAYLRLMLDRFDGDVERALAAYNAGPGRVARARGVPAIRETQGYVAAVLNRMIPVHSPDTGVR